MQATISVSYHKASGWYFKKIRGKQVYLSKDKETALRKLLKLRAGEVEVDDGSIKSIANQYVDKLLVDQAAGRVSPAYVTMVKDTIRIALKALGPIQANNIAPMQWAKVKQALSIVKTGDISHHYLNARLSRIKSMVSWAVGQGLMLPPTYGNNLNSKGGYRSKSKDVSAQEFNSILVKAKHIKPLLWLMANAGLEPITVSAITYDQYQTWKQNRYVDLPRSKTNQPRRFYLWQETIAAIEAYDAVYGLRREGPMLRTTKGTPWSTRSLAAAYKALATDSSPYSIRRMFASQGSATGDIEALRMIMGHAASSMTSRYVRSISDQRIYNVCEAVRVYITAGQTSGK